MLNVETAGTQRYKDDLYADYHKVQAVLWSGAFSGQHRLRIDQCCGAGAAFFGISQSREKKGAAPAVATSLN